MISTKWHCWGICDSLCDITKSCALEYQLNVSVLLKLHSSVLNNIFNLQFKYHLICYIKAVLYCCTLYVNCSFYGYYCIGGTTKSSSSAKSSIFTVTASNQCFINMHKPFSGKNTKAKVPRRQFAGLQINSRRRQTPCCAMLNPK